MPLKTLLPALVAVVLLAGCKPDAAPAPAAEAPAADAPAPEAARTGALAAVDPAALAGTFTGTLPCADCPGIDTVLELRADGSAALTETYQERGEAEPSRGTWTVEEAGTRLRFDPEDKASADRLYAIVSGDELTQLDLEGDPIESGFNYGLERKP
ncbi:copper resistance protein NlpE [Luteimonas sp. R10]|uniref:copper resistance protein NlpE n=1 Tax=Luteimonas sp. R10 TaxID=3108176 RepID=UPI00308FC450|nr:copper resistance protein NlpE [Luteimonas sp. R10]